MHSLLWKFLSRPGCYRCCDLAVPRSVVAINCRRFREESAAPNPLKNVKQGLLPLAGVFCGGARHSANRVACLLFHPAGKAQPPSRAETPDVSPTLLTDIQVQV